jgi:imidazolonepropionase
MTADSGDKFGALFGGEPIGCIGVAGGLIAWIGSEADLFLLSCYQGMQEQQCGYAACASEVHDIDGCWVSPALIDCHTHLIYGGDRCAEWELKLRGASCEYDASW